jgi:hypothetical protein
VLAPRKRAKSLLRNLNPLTVVLWFSVDPRIELYHAVVLGIGLPMISPVDIDYKQTVAKEMAKYKSHPLFTFAERNLKHGKVFNAIDAPIWFLLHLTNDFEWRKELAYPDQSNVYIDSFRYH